MKHNLFKQDKFSKLAKNQNYRSRASLKLLQIHQKECIFQAGDKVLDLGCAPGSWSQVAWEIIGTNGYVVGVDLLPVLPYKNITFLEQSFHEVNEQMQGANVILSDMCPNKTGNCTLDQQNMFDMCSHLLELDIYQKARVFICKFFYSPLEKEFNQKLKSKFKIIKKCKPAASRSVSSEFYYVCKM